MSSAHTHTTITHKRTQYRWPNLPSHIFVCVQVCLFVFNIDTQLNYTLQNSFRRFEKHLFSANNLICFSPRQFVKIRALFCIHTLGTQINSTVCDTYQIITRCVFCKLAVATDTNSNFPLNQRISVIFRAKMIETFVRIVATAGELCANCKRLF